MDRRNATNQHDELAPSPGLPWIAPENWLSTQTNQSRKL
jgi:hypothetical protein